MASEKGHKRGTNPRPAAGLHLTEPGQRCSLDPDVHDELLFRWETGFTGAAIARGLKQAFPDRAPHLNTVYSEIQRHAADKSGAWTLADPDFSAESARLVLAELEAVLNLSKGRRRYFTKREAWWIARLMAVRDDLEPGGAFRMARNHVAAERRGEQLSPWLDTIEAPLAALHVAAGHRDLFAPKETK